MKTRLIPLLGAEGAAALHARLVERSLATARAASIGPVALACAPDVEHAFFRDCAKRYGATLVPQRDGDLGARMHHACSRALTEARRVIIIGSDCAGLTPGHLRDARRVLAEGLEAVLAPAEDGGYVLIGLTRCDASLFDGIAWGGNFVVADTRARLAALGWKWRELETLWDVDRPEDYDRLIASGVLDAQSRA